MSVDLPLALTTLYAELLERVTTASFEADLAESGVFTPKTIRGRRYWYFQTTEDGKRRQRYVGPETASLLRRIEHHKRGRDDERERRKLVSTLVRSGHLPRPTQEIGAVVVALATAGVFRLRGVLIGTVAFQAYAGMLGSRLAGATLATEDIDIAQFRDVSVAIGDRTPDMLPVLQAVDPAFRPVPGLRARRPPMSYQSNSLRVDFLAPDRGPESDEPVALPALRTDAQPLRFLDFLIYEPEPAVLLNEAGALVLVPSPERFALHKLVVARKRQQASAKVEKDLRQAETLLPLLSRKRPYELRSVWDEAWGRGPKWRRLILESLGVIDQRVRDMTLRIAALPRSAVPGVDLRFDAPQARYDFDRDIVAFVGIDGNSRVECAISGEALEDHFGALSFGRKERVQSFLKSRAAIERLARTKYLEWPIEEPGTLLVKTEDVTAALKRKGKNARRARPLSWPRLERGRWRRFAFATVFR
jgi:hypothetical protein